MSLRWMLESRARGAKIWPLLAALTLTLLFGDGRSAQPEALRAVRLAAPSTAARRVGVRALRALPLAFEPNLGQVAGHGARQVTYLARAAGYTVYLTPDGAMMRVAKSRGIAGSRWTPGESARLDAAKPCGDWSADFFRMKLVGSNRTAKTLALDPLPGRSNYFFGNDPAKWRIGVPHYSRVRYSNVYPGIDLTYYGNRGRLEYDFAVAPGANPDAIRLEVAANPESNFENRKSKIAGMRFQASAFRSQSPASARLAANGDLLIATSAGQLRFHKPVVYQLDGEAGARAFKRRFLDGRYAVRQIEKQKSTTESFEVTFRLAAYDRSKALVIDPFLSSSSYLGGTADDAGAGIALDPSGNIYVTGSTGSPDFPAASPFQSANKGSDDVFIAKLDPTGSKLVYSTYLGGAGADAGQAIAVDSSGDAFVTGTTSSIDFPTTSGVLQSKFGGGTSDGFVTELKADGSGLVYSTYLGGSGADLARAIALDSSGDAYVAGDTQSTNFPTASAFQSASGGNDDAFVAKLNPSGSSLVYSTYLGGSGGDSANGIAVDSAGDAFVVGTTLSSDFPTVKPLQAANAGKSDVFVSVLSPSGSALVYSTYLGGTGFDRGAAIAVDSSGNAYVTGDSASADFPVTSGVFQPSNRGGGDAFVAKISAGGTSLVYSTYLGGTQADHGSSLVTDAAGNVFVTGFTQSSDFPILNALQAAFGGGSCGQGPCADAFVTELNPNGTVLVYSTYLGGSRNDFAQAIVLDPSGRADVTGGTNSLDFPTIAGALQGSYGGSGTSGDAFISRIDPSGSPSAGLSPQKLIFADQATGTTSSPLTVTLTNFGTTTLNISSITADGPFVATNNCGGSIAPGGVRCAISVTFSPADVQAYAGTLTITDDAAGSPQTVPLSGNGVTPAPAVTLSPSSSLSFPAQTVGTTSAAQTITLTNSGSATLTISSIAPTGDFAQTNDCGASLGAGSSCTVSVTFTPTQSGNRTGSVVFTDNAANSPQTVSTSGTGVAVFSVASNLASATIPPGTDSTTFTITVSAPSSFTNSVTLSCTGGGSATCAFNPASVTAGQTSTLTLGKLKAQAPTNLALTVTGTSGSDTSSTTIAINFATFSLAMAPPLVTIPAGQSGSYTLTLTPAFGFNAATELKCQILPLAQGSLCAPDPASVTPDGTNPVTITIKVTTAARSQAPPSFGPMRWPPQFGSPWVSLGGLLVLALLLQFLPGRRERHMRLVLAAVLLLAATWTACGGGSADQVPPGTPAGVYSTLVNATSGGLTQTVKANLVIQ